MGSSISVVMLLLSLVGDNELLNYVSTQDYWKNQQVKVEAATMLAYLKAPEKPGDTSAAIKDLGSDDFKVREAATAKLVEMGPGIIPQVQPLTESKDAEISQRAKDIIAKLNKKTAAQSANKLMAIRTLGELKSKEALPALEKLTDSKEPFVADQAKRAIAAINGKMIELAKVDAQALAGDVYLLPKNVALVAQASANFGKPTSGAKLIEMLLAQAPEGSNKEEITAKVSEGTLKALEMVGNIRRDGVTMGLADEMGRNKETGKESGFVVLIARGQYDPAKVKAAILDAGKDRMASTTIEGIEAITPTEQGRGEKMVILMPSSQMIVFSVGPTKDCVPVKELAAALKAGKGTFGENADMVKLVKGVKAGCPIWGVVRMSESYKQDEKILANVDSAMLTTEVKDGVIKAAVTFEGTDDEKVKTAKGNLDEALASAKKEMDRMAGRMPAFKVIGDIKTSLDGKKMSATLELKDEDLKSGLVGLVTSMFSARTRAMP